MSVSPACTLFSEKIAKFCCRGRQDTFTKSNCYHPYWMYHSDRKCFSIRTLFGVLLHSFAQPEVATLEIGNIGHDYYQWSNTGLLSDVPA